MNAYDAINFIAKCGVEVRFKGDVIFILEGFYKSGHSVVDTSKSTITCRYNEVTEVKENGDFVLQLLAVNKSWHEYSEDKFSGWSEEDSGWARVRETYKV